MVCRQNLNTDYIPGLVYHAVYEMENLSYSNIQIPFKLTFLNSLPREGDSSKETLAEMKTLFASVIIFTSGKMQMAKWN